MCGIFAFSSITEVTKAMAPILALEMENRGDDSWGCTDGNHYHKAPVSILEGWPDFPRWDTWDSAIFHTRGASVGKISKENAHPFWAFNKAGKLVIGVHNGHVSNWREMNDKYKRTCEVDSEHIFLHLGAGLDLGELGSSGAIVWFDDKQLKFAKTASGSLECVRLSSGEIVICSTMTAIRKAAAMVGVKIASFLKEIKSGYEHTLAMDGEKLKVQEGQDIHFVYGCTTSKTKDWGTPLNRRHQQHQSSFYRKNCSICYKQVEQPDDIACQTCLDEAELSVQSWEAGNRLKEMPRYLGMMIQ